MVETTLYKEFLILPVPTLKEHADNLFHITQQNSLKKDLWVYSSGNLLGKYQGGKK